VAWTYVVENTGNVTLTNVTVADDQGVTVTCVPTAPATLVPGESMTCTASGVAAAGPYANIGTVTGITTVPSSDGEFAVRALKPPDPVVVTASDPSHYFGVDASIDIEKATNGQDADTPTGPSIPVGNTVTWTYVVTNTGNVALTGVTVVDDKGVTVTCPRTTLAVGETMTCVATGVAVAGQYANNGTVAGFDPSQTIVTDIDPSHYYGKAILPVTGIDADRLAAIGLILLTLGLVAVLATRRRKHDTN
jgi:LPXTG-motif cell wall-anchored protein